MKKRNEKFFLTILLVFQIILFGIMIVFAVTLTKNVSVRSGSMLNQLALNVSKEYMRERVENVISIIEQEKQDILKGVTLLGDAVYQKSSVQKEDGVEDFLESVFVEIQKIPHGELMQFILQDKRTDQYRFYCRQEDKNTFDSKEILQKTEEAPYCRKIEFENKILYILCSAENVNRKTKEHIYQVIHSAKYGEDGYVWVNEVLNYEGGENYAIRRIHPSLKSTEGQYLSTDMQDVEGNYHYLTELEEIKKKGEVFHIYYFKNRRDDSIREKASYAKLYEPFHWIIATGDPLDDVLLYSSALNKNNQKTLKDTLAFTIVILAVIFAVDIILIILNNRKIREKISLEEKIANNEKAIKKADYEVMTGLLRRDPGERKVKEFLETSGEAKGALMIIDLDDLKGINDTLGHKAGDEAIIAIADTMKHNFRETDVLMRYGGDEFIAFLPGVEDNFDSISKKTEKMCRLVSEIFVGEKKERNIHCSIGITYVSPGDTFGSLFSRADKALYYVKRNGKNNFAFYHPGMEEQ